MMRDLHWMISGQGLEPELKIAEVGRLLGRTGLASPTTALLSVQQSNKPTAQWPRIHVDSQKHLASSILAARLQVGPVVADGQIYHL